MVGERLAELREQKALTLRELEEASGVGADAISKIENGHRKPRPSTLRKLAAALGVEVEDFFREPAVPLVEAPRGPGQSGTQPAARDVAREAGRKQYEIDRKSTNRLSASEGVPQTYLARAHDEALFGDLRHRHPDELADALLESGRDVARLEGAVASRDQRIAQLEQENAQLKEGDTRMRQENARLRQDLAEYRAAAEREQEAAR